MFKKLVDMVSCIFVLIILIPDSVFACTIFNPDFSYALDKKPFSMV